MGHRGDGLAETAGGTVFVPYTLPGETVEVETVAGHPDRRHLLAIERPSPDRVDAICPHFGVCGGCAVQHWRSDRYRTWKRGLVTEALAQTGLRPEINDLIDAHGAGRRRAVLHARSRGRGILEVGFSASRSHRIVPIDRCPVLSPDLAHALEVAWDIAELLAEARKPLDIAVTATEGGLDIDIRGSGRLGPAVLSQLAAVAEARDLARLTRHGELVAQRMQPTVRMGRTSVALPPGAFLQATVAGETELARLVLEHVGSARTVADLFAGVGPFALRLAESARVTAVDSDGAAIAALAQAAQMTQGLKPVATERRDLFRRPLLAAELDRFEAVVFDPPRQGAGAQAAELARSGVPVAIAVSCNPATFARDVRVLCDGGYRIERVTPIDQFRYSPHTEIVAQLARA
jgi:23S rRNA (uracil1939-C5)-methyltransferase